MITLRKKIILSLVPTPEYRDCRACFKSGAPSRLSFEGLRHGLSTPDSDEAAIKRAMVTSAHRVVVVADSSKVGREDLISFAPIDRVDVLITDSALRESDRAELLAHDVEVVTA